MAHRIRPGLLHGRPLSSFPPFPATQTRGKVRLSVKIKAAGVLLSIWTAPVAVTTLGVLLLKPSGALSVEHNAVFWIGSSIAIGFAIVLGAGSLTWVFRYMSQVCMDHLIPLIKENQQRLLDELDAEESWRDGEPSIPQASR